MSTLTDTGNPICCIWITAKSHQDKTCFFLFGFSLLQDRRYAVVTISRDVSIVEIHVPVVLAQKICCHAFSPVLVDTLQGT